MQEAMCLKCIKMNTSLRKDHLFQLHYKKIPLTGIARGI